mmetsp:Transcript_18637/g.74415  ORF Transcript_18637/g.74415 Transcript_18637/m.74415 type:complete len:239 (-) Transcript_18637:393-1109(-)
MGDSWEDDEFEVADLAATAGRTKLDEAPTSWEDEEEEDDEAAAVIAKVGQKPSLSEATRRRLEQQAEADKTARLEALLDEEETAEDRKLRERRLVEEGDHELTDELFGAKKDDAVDPDAVVVKLKDLKDHLALVPTLNEKMAASKPNHVVAFTKEFLRTNEEKWEATDLADMIAILTAQREAKIKAKQKPTVSKKEQKGKKASKKEQLQAQKRHEDNFGAASGGDKYDQYDDQFDEFF